MDKIEQLKKKARIKHLRELHSIIKHRQYPSRMTRDRGMVLHALERRIFKLNGGCRGLRSES